jgi:hypothetical protein
MGRDVSEQSAFIGVERFSGAGRELIERPKAKVLAGGFEGGRITSSAQLSNLI